MATKPEVRRSRTLAALWGAPIGLLGGLIGLGGAEFRLPVLAGVFGYAARRAVVYSFETTRERVMLRLTSTLTSVPLSAMLTDDASKQEWIRIIHSASNPVWSRLYVFGSVNLTVTQMREHVRQISEVRTRAGKEPLRGAQAAT